MTRGSRYVVGALLASLAASAFSQTSATSGTVPAPAPAVIVQCPCPPPGGDERALRAQLDQVRGRLAKAKEESSMPEHAVAALLVSDHPDLAALEPITRRHSVAAGHGRVRHVEVEVYVSPHPEETMTAVVVTLRNPREAPAWEPKEARITAQFARSRGDQPVPVTLRSVPRRILPGQTARIALVFDRSDVDLNESPATLSLLRNGKWEMEIELQPGDVQVASAKSGGDR